MIKHFEAISATLKEKYLKNQSEKKQIVYEIGSNDGIFLQNFLDSRFYPIGIDPSTNVSEIAERIGIKTVTDFFSHKLAQELQNMYGKAKLIYAANVICHIPQIQDLFEGIKTLLEIDGVFVFEEPYLGDVLQLGSYDQIYDEHVFLFSVHSIAKLAERCGLKLIDVEKIPTHGGSMRYTVGQDYFPQSQNVENILIEEKERGTNSTNTILKFFEQVKNNATQLRKILEDLKTQGLKVYGYGATSKSTTILNYSQIGVDLILGIFDNTPGKIGSYSPGVHIPIIDYASIDKYEFDVLVLFAWNHKQEILSKETQRTSKQIRWLLPFPEPHFE
jgi:methylation protein EvaC